MSEWKNDFKEYRIQILGTLFLAVALGLAWGKCFIGSACILGLTGIVDLWLVFTKQQTVSHWIHRQFGNEVDFYIAVMLVGITWYLLGFTPAVIFTLGLTKGHLFWSGKDDE